MESFRIIEKNGVILLCNAGNLLIQMGKEEKNIYIYRERENSREPKEREKQKKKKKRKKKGKKMEKENKERECIFFPI